MRESLRLLVGPEVESRVDIGLAKDGSGVGGRWCPKTLGTSDDCVCSRLVCTGCAEAERGRAVTGCTVMTRQGYA